MGGTANSYRWIKDGNEVSGATDSLLVIRDYDSAADSGVYFCIITNSIASQLYLRSRKMYVGVERDTFHIHGVADPVAGGAVADTGIYHDGDTALITAAANAGYTFEYWEENGKVVSVEPAYRFEVTKERSLVAHFRPGYEITAATEPVAGGYVGGTGGYEQDETAVLTAAARRGYTFVNWTDNGTEVSTDAVYRFVVAGERTLTAHFELKTFGVSVNVEPENSGVISGTGTYTYGDTAHLSAAANTDYVFVNWTENDTEISTDPELSFPVTGDRSLVAHFRSTTGVEDLKEDASFILFPNPAEDVICVRPKGAISNEKIRISLTSFAGERNIIKSFGTVKGEIRIDVRRYSPGTYLLEITTDDKKREVYKVVIR